MNILITSSRLPFALDLIRKLSSAGHSVYASDTYESAPGSHSRYLTGHFVTAAPHQQTDDFIADIGRTVSENSIDLVLPAFEEAFYLAARRQTVHAAVFTGEFQALARLHNKATFQSLAEGLGLLIPKAKVAESREELVAATKELDRYFARAVYSRGGVTLLTNTGPLAGHVKLEDCTPTAESPWLVQEYVDGPVVCTYSILHKGKVISHCTYETPHKWRHGTGIAFTSIDGDKTLEVVEKIGAELEHTGQLSFDFILSDRGPALIECNPRATDGVLLMTADQLDDALRGTNDRQMVVEPGISSELDLAVFGSIFTDGLKEIPHNIHDLASMPGAGEGWHDQLPNLYSFLAFAHHEVLSHRNRQKLLEAMSDDIAWNGEPISGMNEQDRAVLDQISSQDRAASAQT